MPYPSLCIWFFLSLATDGLSLQHGSWFPLSQGDFSQDRMHSNLERAIRRDSITLLTGTHLGRIWMWPAQARGGYQQVETISPDSEASCHIFSGSEWYFLLSKWPPGNCCYLRMVVPVPQGLQALEQYFSGFFLLVFFLLLW